MSRAAVVTGVSTGIGRAVAVRLAAAGWRVFGSVRSADDARAFAAAVPGATALTFDVTDDPAIARAAEEVAAATGGAGLGALVNNAGIAVAGPLQHLSLDRFREQLAVNVTGALAVTQAFLPLLEGGDGRAPGRIVNVSSVAGRMAMPFIGAYAASKFALEGLSDSLRRELMIHGIAVIVVAPASIATPIWDKSVGEGADEYSRTAYRDALDRMLAIADATGRAGLPAERVAEVVLRALTVRRARHRYAVNDAPVSSFLMRRIPPRLLDRLIARSVGLRRR
ncbi:MAG: SDR family NAD(P)-dependent oxidoreductase [Bauldia sp.]|nr:SDR family NAD(P)-dependent oxidoreductase [Bauldia sp.]